MKKLALTTAALLLVANTALADGGAEVSQLSIEEDLATSASNATGWALLALFVFIIGTTASGGGGSMMYDSPS